ncbi:ABC transporter ATP-binding protein [Sedimenticola selenatireducens]|uniref:ATP-binding cassette domain-containing protein n=1 Tax=Sedimenticola selenatireducens TaxID=191960 RepID=A0A558DM80_9GAMM|nr:ATP-binding cassette domain-containing protein [Sedimenticola selenatireducens]TVO78738.1 ATP-binding cassette domain-containing protein [Sedimenticola selenatireducens]TVT62100.1 MAG: ATP-binding cassette domain-containing protein [Sedimenticola selenatireducens]
MITDHTSETPIIKASHVRKQLDGPGGRLTILDDISLQLAAGEVTAILGASGSGKSTLLGLLAGLDEVTSGNIELFGNPLSGLNEDQRAALRAGKVGFVFQSFQLLPGMTALENVMLPLELSGIKKPATGATEALKQVGLADRLQHYPGQLSGGEQQRVAIARAFASGPKILFADEPTGSLDQSTGNLIIDLLFQMREQTGAALLLVTHDERLAARCDHRLLIENGRLESGR